MGAQGSAEFGTVHESDDRVYTYNMPDPIDARLLAKKLQSSLAVEGELPEDGLAAYGDDLMLAVARRIVSGEEDADSVKSVFAEAQQVGAEARRSWSTTGGGHRSRWPSNWSRLESQSKRGGRSSPGPSSWRRSRRSPEGVDGSRPDRSLREGLGLIEADALSMEHLGSTWKALWTR